MTRSDIQSLSIQELEAHAYVLQNKNQLTLDDLITLEYIQAELEA